MENWFYKLHQETSPQSLEHFGFAADLPLVRRQIHIGYHADPPLITFVLAREYLKHLDPGLFQKGIIKEMLEKHRAEIMQWREDALRNLCKKRNIDPSLLVPILEQAKEPKFSHFGPIIHSNKPRFILVYGRLSLLFRDLKDGLERAQAGGLHLVATSMERSHPHSNKNAYSIAVSLEAATKPNARMHITIVGQSLSRPSLMFYWFDQSHTNSTVALLMNHMDRICHHINQDTQLTWDNNPLFESNDDQYVSSRLELLENFGIQMNYNLHN